MRQIPFRVDDELFGAIEEARGDVPRERWLRRLVGVALAEVGVRPNGKTVPEPSSREPDGSRVAPAAASAEPLLGGDLSPEELLERQRRYRDRRQRR